MHYLWFTEYLHIWNCFNHKNTCFHLKCIIFFLFMALNKSYQAKNMGLPWWYSGLDSTCQCRGHRFNPWSEMIPHATEQLSPCATTAEPLLQGLQATTTEALEPYHLHTALLKPMCLEPVFHNKRSHCSEKPMRCSEE